MVVGTPSIVSNCFFQREVPTNPKIIAAVEASIYEGTTWGSTADLSAVDQSVPSHPREGGRSSEIIMFVNHGLSCKAAVL